MADGCAEPGAPDRRPGSNSSRCSGRRIARPARRGLVGCAARVGAGARRGASRRRRAAGAAAAGQPGQRGSPRRRGRAGRSARPGPDSRSLRSAGMVDRDPAVVEDDRRGPGERARQRRGALEPIGRAVRAASNVAQWTYSSVRHRRRCFSAARMAGGATAPQRCSRATVVLRQAPSTAARYGQMPMSAGSDGESPGTGGVGRCLGRPRSWGKDSRTRRGRRSPATAITRPRKRKNPGDDLFSRKAALSVSSALESLTSVFGMGTGVASPLESPGSFASGRFGSGSTRGRDDRAGRRNGSSIFESSNGI